MSPPGLVDEPSATPVDDDVLDSEGALEVVVMVVESWSVVLDVEGIEGATLGPQATAAAMTDARMRLADEGRPMDAELGFTRRA